MDTKQPYLNPLDYFFLDHIMQENFRSKPSTIDALKAIVEDFSSKHWPRYDQVIMLFGKKKIWDSNSWEWCPIWT